MTRPIQKHEIELIENTDGLIVCNKQDREFIARCEKDTAGEKPSMSDTEGGETILQLDGERWLMCWVRLPPVTHPCDKCEVPVPENEHCGNDRPDGTSEYLCPDCYVPEVAS